jgi:hypothetical protein
MRMIIKFRAFAGDFGNLVSHNCIVGPLGSWSVHKRSSYSSSGFHSNHGYEEYLLSAINEITDFSEFKSWISTFPFLERRENS